MPPAAFAALRPLLAPPDASRPAGHPWPRRPSRPSGRCSHLRMLHGRRAIHAPCGLRGPPAAARTGCSLARTRGGVVRPSSRGARCLRPLCGGVRPTRRIAAWARSGRSPRSVPNCLALQPRAAAHQATAANVHHPMASTTARLAALRIVLTTMPAAASGSSPPSCVASTYDATAVGVAA